MMFVDYDFLECVACCLWRLSHYDLCRLWRLSLMTFVALWCLSLIMFVALWHVCGSITYFTRGGHSLLSWCAIATAPFRTHLFDIADFSRTPFQNMIKAVKPCVLLPLLTFWQRARIRVIFFYRAIGTFPMFSTLRSHLLIWLCAITAIARKTLRVPTFAWKVNVWKSKK